jgi:hypothetical protein
VDRGWLSVGERECAGEALVTVLRVVLDPVPAERATDPQRGLVVTAGGGVFHGRAEVVVVGVELADPATPRALPAGFLGQRHEPRGVSSAPRGGHW